MIALRVGATVESVVEQLHNVANEAGNVTGASPGRPEIQGVEDYLRWTEKAESMLNNVLPPDLVSDLVHTRRYWALRAATGAEIRLTPLLLEEVAARKRELDGLAEEFEAERQRWSGGQVLLVVPDTNMFLQKDAPFADIDAGSASSPTSSSAAAATPPSRPSKPTSAPGPTDGTKTPSHSSGLNRPNRSSSQSADFLHGSPVQDTRGTRR